MEEVKEFQHGISYLDSRLVELNKTYTHMWTLHQKSWEDLNKQLEEADGKIKIVIDLI